MVRGTLMGMLFRVISSLIFIVLSCELSYAQKTVVFGEVKDAENGDPVPFANIFFKGTQIGTTTTFDVSKVYNLFRTTLYVC